LVAEVRLLHHVTTMIGLLLDRTTVIGLFPLLIRMTMVGLLLLLHHGTTMIGLLLLLHHGTTMIGLLLLGGTTMILAILLGIHLVHLLLTTAVGHHWTDILPMVEDLPFLMTEGRRSEGGVPMIEAVRHHHHGFEMTIDVHLLLLLDASMNEIEKTDNTMTIAGTLAIAVLLLLQDRWTTE
jgi:hypothetical protein